MENPDTIFEKRPFVFSNCDPKATYRGEHRRINDQQKAQLMKTSKTLLLIPAAAICDSALGDLSDAGLVYETAADAETHLIETVEDQCYGDDCSESDCVRIARKLLAAAVTLDTPTADQVAEAASHRCSPRYARNGHSVGVCAGELSSAHRSALDGGAEVLTSNGAVIRARRSSTGRVYYTVRLADGYRWSDAGSYSKNPTPVRA